MTGPAAMAAPLEDRDARSGRIAPSAEQARDAERMATSVRWSDFGTPRSLIRHGGFLATGVAGADAAAAARNWLDANRSLFGIDSVDGLEVTQDSRLVGSAGHVVGFRQRFGGLPAGVDGQVTLGLRPAGGACCSCSGAAPGPAGSAALTGGVDTVSPWPMTRRVSST